MELHSLSYFAHTCMHSSVEQLRPADPDHTKTERLEKCSHVCMSIICVMWYERSVGPFKQLSFSNINQLVVSTLGGVQGPTDGSYHITNLPDMCCVLRTFGVPRTLSHTMFTSIRFNLINMSSGTCLNLGPWFTNIANNQQPLWCFDTNTKGVNTHEHTMHQLNQPQHVWHERAVLARYKL